MVGTFVLGNEPGIIRGRKYAIVGVYSQSNHSFVQHAALLASDQDLDKRCEVEVHHMGPPLGDQVGCECHLLGQIELTSEEIEVIENWVASVETQYTAIYVQPFQQYTIYPHMTWIFSEEGRPLRQRFSCVGYVIEAYREAGVHLVDLSQVPDTDGSCLEILYPEIVRISKSPPRLKEKLGFKGFDDLGLSGKGPWKLVLPGYLFHATREHHAGKARPGSFLPSTREQAHYP